MLAHCVWDTHLSTTEFARSRKPRRPTTLNILPTPQEDLNSRHPNWTQRNARPLAAPHHDPTAFVYLQRSPIQIASNSTITFLHHVSTFTSTNHLSISFGWTDCCCCMLGSLFPAKFNRSFKLCLFRCKTRPAFKNSSAPTSGKIWLPLSLPNVPCTVRFLCLRTFFAPTHNDKAKIIPVEQFSRCLICSSFTTSTNTSLQHVIQSDMWNL